MEFKIQKKKRYLILLLICLVLSAITAGIYLFVDSTASIPYTVDKYTDTLDWCEPNAENGELKIDCKALLLSIKNQEDNSTCFDVQVISNTKELKDLTVCEKGDTLTYTNEILAYKVLMPVDIVFTYTQGLLNRFSFKNVSFTPLDDTYVQSIVNEDIAKISTVAFNSDMYFTSSEGISIAAVDSSYIIKNSIDMCPNPIKLKTYLRSDINQTYIDFYTKNKLNLNEYTNFYKTSYENSSIEALFACDSSSLMDYNICNFSKKIILNNSIQATDFNITWGNNLNNMEKKYLKYISNYYDENYYKNSIKKENINFDNLVNLINNQGSINENIVCSIYKILKKTENNKEISNVIENSIYNNVQYIQSPLCGEIASTNKFISSEGLFLRLYFANLDFVTKDNPLRIYLSCVNLTNLIK